MNLQFAVTPIRFEFTSEQGPPAAPGLETNFLRGALGAALRRTGCAPDCVSAERCPLGGRCVYAQFFDPIWSGGPSGYRQAPRPFVLRWAAPPQEGGSFTLSLFLFEVNPPLAILERAVALVAERWDGAKLATVRRLPVQRLPIDGKNSQGDLRLLFRTPTELKVQKEILVQPEFLPLITRLAERVWTLGCRYQDWPPPANLGDWLSSGSDVELKDWSWVRSSGERRSARSGATHSLGGFTGWAEYAGPVGKYLPLLEIASWTGVGRQTVWGKGEVAVESFVSSQPDEN